MMPMPSGGLTLKENAAAGQVSARTGRTPENTPVEYVVFDFIESGEEEGTSAENLSSG